MSIAAQKPVEVAFNPILYFWSHFPSKNRPLLVYGQRVLREHKYPKDGVFVFINHFYSTAHDNRERFGTSSKLK